MIEEIMDVNDDFHKQWRWMSMVVVDRGSNFLHDIVYAK